MHSPPVQCKVTFMAVYYRVRFSGGFICIINIFLAFIPCTDELWAVPFNTPPPPSVLSLYKVNYTRAIYGRGQDYKRTSNTFTIVIIES
jgi:hypothetical protein